MTLNELLVRNKYPTDKDNTHSYIPTYEEILYPLKDKNISLLEIGNKTNSYKNIKGKHK